MMNHQNVLSFLLFIAAFLMPIQTVGLAIGALVIADIATGVWASLKTGQKITSDRFSRSVTKSLVYLTALVVALIAQKYLFSDAVPVITVVSGFIGSTELLSVYENLTRISGMDFRKLVQDKILSAQKDKEERGGEQ